MEQISIVRPSYSHDLYLRAAEVFVRDSNIELESSDPEQFAKDLADSFSIGDNGFDIAKAMDDRCHSMTADNVEALDNFFYFVQDELEKDVKAWVRDNDIQPPLPIGCTVRLKDRKQGKIMRVYSAEKATYAVLMAEDYKKINAGQRILSYEDVELVEQPSLDELFKLNANDFRIAVSKIVNTNIFVGTPNPLLRVVQYDDNSFRIELPQNDYVTISVQMTDKLVDAIERLAKLYFDAEIDYNSDGTFWVKGTDVMFSEGKPL